MLAADLGELNGSLSSRRATSIASPATLREALQT